MFTQCTKCETVFRLSAESLRAAGGQVRCGRCGDVFNALARLAEDAAAFTKGESSLDLETRADEILQSLEAVAPAAAETIDTEPGVEIAQLEVIDPIDEELADEKSLEFTLPPGELDRIFIETPLGSLQRLTAVDHRPDDHAHAQPAHDAARPRENAPPHEAATLRESAPPHEAAPKSESAPAREAAALHEAALLPEAAAAHEVASAHEGVREAVPPPVATLPASATRRSPAAPSVLRESRDTALRDAGLAVSEAVRRDMLTNYAHAELPEINATRQRLPFGAWLTAAIALALLLAAQVVGSGAEWLAVPASRLGLGGPPAAKLSNYQLRQWGVTGDPGAKGTLRVRASIMNTAAQLEPYPLLRVTLANRFGSRVGEREFEPSEYMGKATAHMLAPGERVDALLDILDPGKDAEGFEIDVCVRGADKNILCAGDAGPQGR